ARRFGPAVYFSRSISVFRSQLFCDCDVIDWAPLATLARWGWHARAIGVTALRVPAFYWHPLPRLRVDDERRSCDATAFFRIDPHTAIRLRRFPVRGSEHSIFSLLHLPPRPYISARRSEGPEVYRVPDALPVYP